MVKHSNLLDRLRHKLEEVLDGERTIEMYTHQADFFTLLVEVVDRFLYSLADRTHGDDDAVSIFSAIVVEQVMFTARDFGQVCHGLFYEFRQSLIELVGRLAFLEVYVRILRGTADNRMVRIQRPAAEFFNRLPVENLAQIIIVHNFDFLNLMRGTETVEEVNERHTAFNSHEMGYSSQVHNFLYAGLTEHSTAGLTGSHNVLMVTEDIQGVCGQRAGGYMEYARQQFAGYLVEIRNHQQETLRCSICGGQRTSLQGTVYGTSSTSL